MAQSLDCGVETQTAGAHRIIFGRTHADALHTKSLTKFQSGRWDTNIYCTRNLIVNVPHL